MTEAAYSHNHIVNPETGFIENPAYPYAFDSAKKLVFLKAYVDNGLDIYFTCDQLGVERRTVIKHYHSDPVFKEHFDAAEREFAARLEGKSRRNSMQDKSVVERICHLNSFSRKGLTNGKYTDEKNEGSFVVNLNFDVKLLEDISKRNQVIDVYPDASPTQGDAQPPSPDGKR